MRNKPLFTVITVTYNAATTVERTLRSVEEQTYPHIEHIIVDGCSTDQTLAHVREYVERNTAPKTRPIRVLREHDRGLYDAMNKGLALASGVYVCFLNAGDKFHAASTLEEVMRLVDWQTGAPNPAVVYGETDLVDDNGRFLRHRRLTTPEQLTAESFREGMRVCHQSFYARTDLTKQLRYDLAWRYSGDFDWCVRLLKMAAQRRLRTLNTHLVLTDYLHEGLSTKNRSRSLRERLLIMAVHYGWATTLAEHLWFVLRAVLRR